MSHLASALPPADDLARRRRALGRRLCLLRTAQRRSQTKLAEAVGLTSRTLIRLEHGRTWPHLHVLLALCAALGVSPADLLGSPAPTNGSALLTTSLLALCRSLPPSAARRASQLFALIAELPPGPPQRPRPSTGRRPR